MVLQMKKKTDEKPNGIAFDSKTSLTEVASDADNMEVDIESNIDEISSHMERNVAVDDSKMAVGSDGKPHESSSKLVSEDSVSQEVCYGIKCLSRTFITISHCRLTIL